MDSHTFAAPVFPLPLSRSGLYNSCLISFSCLMVSEREYFQPPILISCWFYHHEERWMQRLLPSLRSLFLVPLFGRGRYRQKSWTLIQLICFGVSLMRFLLLSVWLFSILPSLFSLMLFVLGLGEGGNKDQNNLTQCV